MSGLLPDPAERFSDVPGRRVPQLEFGAPIPTFRARQVDEFTEVPANTVELLWDFWENGDERVFEAEMDGVETDKLRIVNLLRPGWYSIDIDIGWAVDFNGNCDLDFADGWDLPTAVFWTRRSGITNVDAAFSKKISYPIFRPQLATPAGFPSVVANTLYQVRQHSGVNRFTDTGTTLEIGYYGQLSVEPWEFPI